MINQLFSTVIIASMLASSPAAIPAISSNQIQKPALVAHGGGGYNGIAITNSLNALDSSYSKGFRFIEVDVNFTSDKIPVLFHDWNDTSESLFTDLKSGISSGTVSDGKVHYMPLSYFKEAPKKAGLTMISFEDLAAWMRAHSDTYIILDKLDPMSAAAIGDAYPDIKTRLIPQAFNFQGYEILKASGFDNIILTLYLTSYSEADIIKFAKNNRLFGICMDYSKLKSMSPSTIQSLRKSTYLFTHTINTITDYKNAVKIGAQGVFTDFLTPSDISSRP